jgi:hypothetical protein
MDRNPNEKVRELAEEALNRFQPSWSLRFSRLHVLRPGRGGTRESAPECEPARSCQSAWKPAAPARAAFWRSRPLSAVRASAFSSRWPSRSTLPLPPAPAAQPRDRRAPRRSDAAAAARRTTAGEIVTAAAARVRLLSRPDHYARLAVVARLIQVLAAGRPIAKVPEPKPTRPHIDDAALRRGGAVSS